jgi:hypothetical protein
VTTVPQSACLRDI